MFVVSLPTLLVCLKHPTAGRVKTRLAASLGPQQAAELYRHWIGQVFDSIQPIRREVRIVAYFTGADLAAFSDWKHLADEWWQQPDGDLGARLAQGFARAAAAGGSIAAIGTDCLDLDATLLTEAFESLENHDAVFGPTLDGGYYLVGTSRLLPGFFDGIPWSTPQTLAAHRDLCQSNGWSYSQLPARRDIDTLQDWQAYCDAASSASPFIVVVIPTLNEETNIAAAIRSVGAHDGVRIIVADGGSTDATLKIAWQMQAEVVNSPRRGRGCQIAAALQCAKEQVVLVLHADARLPADAIPRIRRHLLEHPECPGGSLGHRFDSCERRCRIVEAVDAFRARRGMSYGDQGQFFRVAELQRAGGFPAQALMEDVELSRRLLALGKPAYLNCPILTSPRRIERLGLGRFALLNFALRTAYRLGGPATCERLYRLYYRPDAASGASSLASQEVSK